MESNWKKYVRDKENTVPANSGQIVQEYLSQRAAEGFVYTFKGKGLPRKQHPRKCLLRVYKDLTMPVDRPSRDIREHCREKFLFGEIDMGVNIVERQYEKQILTKSGAIETHKFSVYRKKHPLTNIRRNLLKKHYRYLQRNSDAYFENIDIATLTERLASPNELNRDDSINTMKQKLKNFERRRNIIMWHDASVIANHSHILFCVNVMYDPAVFCTPTEYQEISGDTVDVQAEIERPELYIIGRCRSNDEQLGYIETRLECLKDLGVGVNLKTIDNQYEDVTISDRMCFLHGDGPAAAFEAGNQKGGRYLCPSCDVHSSFTDNISYSYQLALHSLEDIRQMVLQGNIGKERSMKKVTCPFENLNGHDL